MSATIDLHRQYLLKLKAGCSAADKTYIEGELLDKESVLAALISTETFLHKTFTVSSGQATYLKEKIDQLGKDHPRLAGLCQTASDVISCRSSLEVSEPDAPSESDKGGRNLMPFKRILKHLTVADFQSCDVVRSTTYMLMYGQLPNGETYKAMMKDCKGRKSTFGSGRTTQLLQEEE